MSFPFLLLLATFSAHTHSQARPLPKCTISQAAKTDASGNPIKDVNGKVETEWGPVVCDTQAE